jgi:hypothetical protein
MPPTSNIQILTTTREWAQMTCQIPVPVEGNGFDKDDPSDAKLDARAWYLYRSSHEEKLSGLPGLIATTNREKSKLIDIIGETTAMLYTLDTTCVNARHVLSLYGRFTKWRNELPDVLKNLGSRKTPALPHILSLWYVMALYPVVLVNVLGSYMPPRSPTSSVRCWNFQASIILPFVPSCGITPNTDCMCWTRNTKRNTHADISRSFRCSRFYISLVLWPHNSQAAFQEAEPKEVVEMALELYTSGWKLWESHGLGFPWRARSKRCYDVPPWMKIFSYQRV